ncbi:MAG TPA: sugar phosphate isomerase/epimerase [Verrucomicrobiales bacterium]|nr:sugar phosphate isomerase/epimerase [Verrucomicrobiae bacterium]MCP5556078.1 sugar phosphate isomerase/epimerase [Akkermansiaceae bacterium]HRX54234.1 sugar phosphate isomerase/epimerase [Verrucomicrobiales bacterium]
MSNIKFGSQVYTWFMQGTGKGYDNKLDHMIKIAAQAGFKGIEPMVLEVSERGLGCSSYWLGDFKDPAKLKDALAEHGIELAGLALVCGWDAETETPEEKAAADYTIETLKHFPGAKLGTVPLPSGRKNLQERRLNLVRNVNAVSRRAVDAGLVCSFHPNSPPASLVRTQEDYDVVLSSLNPCLTGWTPDVGHIIRGGMDVIATLDKWSHLVNHIHYKDFSGNGPEPWAQMGTGKLDFHKITEWLTLHNYEGWIICEDEAHVAVEDPDGVTLQNGQWCQDNLVGLV